MLTRFPFGPFIPVVLLGIVPACGGAIASPASPEAPAIVAPAVGKGSADAGVDLGVVRELSIRVAPNQSVAYRIKSKTESPGRKTEQDSTLFLDAWSDGTIAIAHENGERERSGREQDLKDALPLPEGAQSSYTRTHEEVKGDKHTVNERFERVPLQGQREQISFRIERKRTNIDEAQNGIGTFDVAAMRYERLRIEKIRQFTKAKPNGDLPKPTKTEVEATFDPEATAKRTKDRAARREVILKAAQEPPTTPNPAAEIAAGLASTDDSTLLSFHARARPAQVWRAVLAYRASNDRIRGLAFDGPRVPDEVLPDVRATIRKSPSHPAAWLVLATTDPRLIPEIEIIAKRHQEEEAREIASERLKTLRRLAQPLAVRLKTHKPSRRSFDSEILYMDVDPDRDRAALFEYVLPKLATAPVDERASLAQALSNLAKVSLPDEHDAWKQYWDSHKQKAYDEWLIEALQKDPAPHSRGQAASALGERPPTEANKKALREALTDKDENVRLDVAQALAALRDEAAVLPLVRALPHEMLRMTALQSLAYFSETNFGLEGFDHGKPDESLAPLGRWLAWAKRRGLEPGFP